MLIFALACSSDLTPAPSKVYDTGIVEPEELDDTDIPGDGDDDDDDDDDVLEDTGLIDTDDTDDTDIWSQGTDTGLFLCPNDDVEEPNDGMADALSLSTGTFNVTDHSDDWFAFTMPASGTATVEVLFSHADGDIELTVVDDANSVKGWSYSSSDDESVTISGWPGHTYYAEVDLVIGHGCNVYDLVIN